MLCCRFWFCTREITSTLEPGEWGNAPCAPCARSWSGAISVSTDVVELAGAAAFAAWRRLIGLAASAFQQSIPRAKRPQAAALGVRLAHMLARLAVSLRSCHGSRSPDRGRT